MDKHTAGKWLIHGTKRRKDNQLQIWNSLVEYPSRECKYDNNAKTALHVIHGKPIIST